MSGENMESASWKMLCFNRLETYKLEGVCKSSLFEWKGKEAIERINEIFKSSSLSDIFDKSLWE